MQNVPLFNQLYYQITIVLSLHIIVGNVYTLKRFHLIFFSLCLMRKPVFKEERWRWRWR